jgi:ClpP class serine protease
MRIFDAICGAPWAMAPDRLQAIVEVVLAVPEETAEQHAGRIVALEAKLGRKLDNTREVTVRDGIATIPVVGPISRYMNLFTEISGGTSTELLARDFRTAADDPGVKGIILSLDSPGGEAAGISELADLIASARGTKPIVAHAGGDCCSGAYWIASACDEVVSSDAAILGSIGVAAVVRDTKNPKAYEFVASVSPDKRPDPATEKGRATIQKTIDSLGELFVAKVAGNRGTTRDKVLADFGRGGVLVGAEAVSAGMADRIGTYESTHAALAARVASGANLTRRTAAMSEQEKLTDAPPAPAERAPGVIDENAALRAKIEAITAGRRQDATEAAADYAEAMAAAGRILPRQREALAAVVALVAHDDIDSPRPQGSRLGVLKAFVATIEPHQMGRQVAAADLKRLGITPAANGSSSRDEDRALYQRTLEKERAEYDRAAR